MIPGEYDWTGFIPFGQLPRTFNPASGRIANANHRIVPKDYPWYLTDDWSPPYRAQRIFSVLERTARHGMKNSAALQTDNLSLAARDLVPVLLRHLGFVGEMIVELPGTASGSM